MESSHLEPETQETEPKKYHEAWRAVVSAGYGLFADVEASHVLTNALVEYWSPEALANEVLRV